MRKDGEDMELTLDTPPRLRPGPRGTRNRSLRRAPHSTRRAIPRSSCASPSATTKPSTLLYDRYVRPVFGLALRRLRDRQRAEDAVQETFAAVWRSAQSYRPERGPAAPWLYTVARNAIVDRQRAKTEQPAEVPDTASGELGPAERAEASFVGVARPPRARRAAREGA